MMKRPEALVFDMDGLIFDSERIVQRSWEDTGDKLGIPHLGSHIYHTLGLNVAGRMAYFRKEIGEDFPEEAFNQGTRTRFREIVEAEGLPMKTGARELLAYAKEQGYKIAVATSSRRAYAETNLKEAGIYSYFDGAVFGDMVHRSKPDPEIYLMACEAIDVKPDRAMALEDAPNGIRAAYAARMMPVMIPDLVRPDEEVKKLLCAQCETLHDVIPLLESCC